MQSLGQDGRAQQHHGVQPQLQGQDRHTMSVSVPPPPVVRYGNPPRDGYMTDRGLYNQTEEILDISLSVINKITKRILKHKVEDWTYGESWLGWRSTTRSAAPGPPGGHQGNPGKHRGQVAIRQLRHNSRRCRLLHLVFLEKFRLKRWGRKCKRLWWLANAHQTDDLGC